MSVRVRLASCHCRARVRGKRQRGKQRKTRAARLRGGARDAPRRIMDGDLNSRHLIHHDTHPCRIYGVAPGRTDWVMNFAAAADKSTSGFITDSRGSVDLR